MYELQAIYEHSFNKLTEKFYAKESWPEPEAISPLVNDGKDSPFLIAWLLHVCFLFDCRSPMLPFFLVCLDVS